MKIKSKVTSALAYPAFMAFFGSGIISLLMVVVVPKVAAIFSDFQKALPWYTALLITVSGFLGNYWWLVMLLLAAGGALFYRWKRTAEGGYRWDEIAERLSTTPAVARQAFHRAVTRAKRFAQNSAGPRRTPK